MRIVRWTPQERVDVPDITAMSFLALGEFRRQMRGVMLGPGTAPATARHDLHVIRGFAVEPQAVPDSTLRVRLDPGADVLSFALGAEDLGTRLDYGAVVGGDDAAGNTEGNATVTLDFAALGANTYTVEMRFVYTTGVADNRAFWNPSTNSEFVASVDTRHLPAVELQAVTSATGDEWLPLATVAWTGGGDTIEAGDITDIRDFVVEGSTPWQQTTQDGSGGIGDFSRSTDRAANGQHEVFPALRMALRQIQDIKGPDSAGNWNAWNRVFQPFDPGAALPTEQTKHLQSLDTVTFTVGDGTTTFGDFNGSTGLDDCLQHIEADEASFPERIRILVRSHQTGANTPTFTIANATSLTDKHVEIIGQSNGTVRGQVHISVTLTAGNVLQISGAGSVRLENLGMTSAPTDAGIALVDNVSGFGCILRNCTFYSDTATAATRYCLSLPTEGLLIDHCELHGRCLFAGANSTPTHTNGGYIRNTQFVDTAVELFVSGLERASGLTFDRCELTAPSTPYTSQALAVIQAGQSDNCTFRDCEFDFHPDQDGVRLEASNRMHFYGCRWTAAAGSITHAIGAGGNGAAGTGWCIYGASSVDGLVVRDCEIYSHFDVVDAGGIYAAAPTNVLIDGLTVRNSGSNSTASAEFIAIDLAGSGEAVRIVNSDFRLWNEGGTEQAIAINIGSTVLGTVIQGCTFDGRDELGGAMNGVTLFAVNCTGDYTKIIGCEFRFWDNGNALANDCIQITSDYCIVQGCFFDDNGGFPVVLTTASGYCNISGNTFRSTAANNLGIDADGNNHALNHNTFDFSAGARDAIQIDDAASTFFTCIGNVGTNTITQIDSTTGTGTIVGYNETQDVNVAMTYV